MITIVAFYALMAGVFTVGKQVVLYAYPFFLTALRLPVAGTVFLLYARYIQKNPWRVTKDIGLLLF